MRDELRVAAGIKHPRLPRLRRFLDGVRAGFWRDEMSAEEIATFEAIAGETLAALGYN